MGYFANGTEGMIYEERYCAKCIQGADGKSCAVWMAHLLFSSEQHDKDGSTDTPIGNLLALLIPQTADGLGNERCAMFTPAVLPPTGGFEDAGWPDAWCPCGRETLPLKLLNAGGRCHVCATEGELTAAAPLPAAVH